MKLTLSRTKDHTWHVDFFHSFTLLTLIILLCNSGIAEINIHLCA